MEEAVGKVRKRRGEGEEGDNCRNYHYFQLIQIIIC